jgi:hypothetical protein
VAKCRLSIGRGDNRKLNVHRFPPPSFTVFSVRADAPYTKAVTPLYRRF